jgi:hypothetical protein
MHKKVSDSSSLNTNARVTMPARRNAPSCDAPTERRKLFVCHANEHYVHAKAKGSRTGTATHALGR